MIGHHIAKRASRLIEGPTALHADRFRHGHLDMVDAVAVPDRFEHSIGEAQRHDVLHRLLAEEVVDPEDLIFAECPQNTGVQRARRLQVVAEGFLEHDAPPVAGLAVFANRLLNQSRLVELLDRWAEELLGDGKVEDDVALGPLGLLRLRERSAQFIVELGLAQIALHIIHLVGEAAPSLLVNTAAVEFRGFSGIAFQLFAKIIAPAFGGCIRSGRADKREVFGEQPRARQIIERRNQEACGQVPACAEDNHGAWPRRLRFCALGTLYQLND